jgi:DUF4097 and DUF4098 domain-containing protein YvlB
MHTFSIFLTCLLFSWGFQNPETGKEPSPAEPAPYIEREQKQFNFYPGGKLQVIAAAGGDIKIVGWQRASILVETERIIHGLPPQKAKELARQCPVQIRYDQTSSTIQTIRPLQSSTSVEVNVTIYVPKEKTDIKASIAQGDFAVEGINGWIEATLNEGNLEARFLSGYFSAMMKRGNVQAELSGKRWSGLEFAAITQAGDIRLLLPGEYSTALNLETRAGNISVAYPDQVVDGQAVPLAVLTQKKLSTLSAKIGEGGSPIRLLTMAGDVSLSASK